MKHDRGMIDLQKATREELIQLIEGLRVHVVRLEEHITHLVEHIAEFEGNQPLESEQKPKQGAPAIRAKPNCAEKGQKPRAKRTRNSGRARSKQTR